VIIGAGTVMDAQTAQTCIEAGAQFIVSPALSLETIAFCKQQGVLVMPGALTPTEVVTAWSAGADFVKVFSRGRGGRSELPQALKAPLPHIKLVPTGGFPCRLLRPSSRLGPRPWAWAATWSTSKPCARDATNWSPIARSYLLISSNRHGRSRRCVWMSPLR